MLADRFRSRNLDTIFSHVYMGESDSMEEKPARSSEEPGIRIHPTPSQRTIVNQKRSLLGPMHGIPVSPFWCDRMYERPFSNTQDRVGRRGRTHFSTEYLRRATLYSDRRASCVLERRHLLSAET